MSMLLGLGLNSIVELAALLGGANIAVSAGGSIINYLAINKLSKSVTAIGGRTPLPPGGPQQPIDDEEGDAGKRAHLRLILVKEYGMYPVNISVVPLLAGGRDRAGMIAQISVDSPKRLDANSLRYLASRMELPVTITYVRVCSNCRATAQPEVERCPSCGTPFSTEKVKGGSTLTPHRATPDMSEDLGKLVKREDYLIVDGSNLATGNGGQVAYMWPLQMVMAQVEGRVKGYRIFVGSRFRHIIQGTDKEEFAKLEAEGKVFQGMRGSDDDDILLHEANKQNAIVLTRDAYAKKEALDENSPQYNDVEMQKVRERMQTYPWLVDKTRFIGHYVDFAEKTITFQRFMPIPPVVIEKKKEKMKTGNEIPEEEEHSTIDQKEPGKTRIDVKKKPFYVECPSCHKSVRTSDYCSQCGTPLKEGVTRVMDDTCPYCGEIINRWTLTCNNCGALFDGWKCDICNSPIDMLAEQCSTCGTRYVWKQ